MKIDLAVYTAQEGYSWQPGTVFAAEELTEFKKRIGKFPSPDASDFPFGGVFRLEDRVVFYRYHVAKKIDFCGRDALYCVLGAVSRAEAAKIVPAALFASPEFAGPMKPFPTALELPEAESSAVPEWLKNLDRNTLDVRITGPAENPKYAVVQAPVEVPKPPIDTKGTRPAGDPGAGTPAGGADGAAAPTGTGGASGATGGSGAGAGPGQQPSSAPVPVKKLPPWMVVVVAVLALLIAGLSTWAIWYCWKRYVTPQPPTADDPAAVTNSVPAKTAVAAPTNVSETVKNVPPASTNASEAVKSAPPASTNASEAVKSVPPASTNASEAVKSAPPASTNVSEAVKSAPPAATNVSVTTTKQPEAVSTKAVPAANAPINKPASSAKPKNTSAQKSHQSSKPNRSVKPAPTQKKPSGKATGKNGPGK